MLVTTIVNDCVAVAVASLAVITTALSPTSAFSGVPDSTPVVVSNEAQPGRVVAARVSVSPSSSDAVTVYV